MTAAAKLVRAANCAAAIYAFVVALGVYCFIDITLRILSGLYRDPADVIVYLVGLPIAFAIPLLTLYYLGTAIGLRYLLAWRMPSSEGRSLVQRRGGEVMDITNSDVRTLPLLGYFSLDVDNRDVPVRLTIVDGKVLFLADLEAADGA